MIQLSNILHLTPEKRGERWEFPEVVGISLEEKTGRKISNLDGYIQT